MCGVAIMAGEDWWWKAWGQILHSVQTGKSSFEHVHGMRFFEYMTKNPEAGAIFDKAMANYASQTGLQVASAYPFSKARVVVDVGGGHGALIADILQRYPDMQGINFDMPANVRPAKGFLEAQRLLNRCQVLGGDFLESVPEGGDLYLLQHVLHDWDDENASKILRNCRRVMPPDGKLLLVEMVIPSGNDPFLGKFLDLGMLMMESGACERTENEYRDLLSASGFHMTRIITLPSPDSIIQAVPNP